MNSRRRRSRRATGTAAAACVLVLLGGCGQQREDSRTTAADGAPLPSAGAVDLHTANLGFLTVPGALCGNPDDVELRNGLAAGVGEWTAYEPPSLLDLHAYAGDTVFDDLDGDGRDEAFLPAQCAIEGGTAASVTATGVFVVSGASGAPQVLGTITAGYDTGDGNATRLSVRSVGDGRIVVDEAVYGVEDGSCCPSGRAVTTWTWDGRELSATGTDIEQPPAGQAFLETCGTGYCRATDPVDVLGVALQAYRLGEFPAFAQLAPAVDLDRIRLASEAGPPGAPECTDSGAGDRITCRVLLGDEAWTYDAEPLGYPVTGQNGTLWVLTDLRQD